MTPWPRTRRAGTFEEYRRILTALFEMAGGTSCIDLGCGEAHVTQHFPNTLLVDLVPRLNQKIPVAQWDLLEAPKRTKDQNFDLLFMGDSIEHLHKDDAELLLADMSSKCKAMAIFTPVGPWHLRPESEDPDAHKSAWHPEELYGRRWMIWEWPSYHRYENGECLGGFWAWRFSGIHNPSVQEVAQKAGVEI